MEPVTSFVKQNGRAWLTGPGLQSKLMRTTWAQHKTELIFQLALKESTPCICLLCIHHQLEHRLVCISLHYGQQRHPGWHIVLIHPV